MNIEQVVNDFILDYGVKSVVVAKSFDDNSCLISLKGGYSITIKVVDGYIYKNDVLYGSI